MFFKMVGWVSYQMQNEIEAFYNKRCTLGYGKVTKNSIFYKYLVNISSNSPVTDRLKRAYAVYEN
jgi:hypothetical protein